MKLLRPKPAIIAAVTLLITIPGCGDELVDDDPSRSCVCTPEICPEEQCNIAVELPLSCLDLFDSATVSVNGGVAGQAIGGERFGTCEEAIGIGESATVDISAGGGFTAPTRTVTCETGGFAVEPEYCTLRFALGSSCDGYTETAEIVVDGVLQGEVQLETPFIPCLLLSEGDEVIGTIRAADVVLTSPLQCLSGNAETQLTMECGG